METLDPKSHTLVVGGNLISGFMPGTFITVAREARSWSVVAGADGEVARMRSRNKIARVTVTLMESSPSNAVLSALLNTDEQLGTPAGACYLTDTLGTTVLGGDESFSEGLPDVNQADEVQGREWVIVVPVLEGTIGAPA